MTIQTILTSIFNILVLGTFFLFLKKTWDEIKRIDKENKADKKEILELIKEQRKELFELREKDRIMSDEKDNKILEVLNKLSSEISFLKGKLEKEK